jgi:hypothetical protein
MKQLIAAAALALIAACASTPPAREPMSMSPTADEHVVAGTSLKNSRIVHRGRGSLSPANPR